MSIKDLKERIKSLDNLNVKIGWFAETRYDDSTPVAQVAQWQEYGTAKIPPRPFFRPCMDANKGRWQQDMDKACKAVIDGKVGAKDALTAVGEGVKSDLQQTISRVSSPPLSPVTLLLRQWRKEGQAINGTAVLRAISAVRKGVEAKGVSDQPLNDTGHMIASVQVKVSDES